MHNPQKYSFVAGQSFSDLYRDDAADGRYAFLLSYPSTASWSPYPNTKTYLIQDGNLEENKVGFDKIRQKEPWKCMAALGEELPGIITAKPPDLLSAYWRDHFGFTYNNIALLPHARWIDVLNDEAGYDRIITLFPYDRLRPELHAVNPDVHYRLLSKCHLAEICPSVPPYQVIDLHQTDVDDLPLPPAFPYLVKTSHGLSGEGTYIVQNESDLAFCLSELRIYRRMGLARHIVAMDFVPHVTGNYCAQFYVNRKGEIGLIGATSQLVSPAGNHLGGVIHYDREVVRRFIPIIEHTAQILHQSGYFGVVGIDILEDRDGQPHVVDANIRVNGSTPLCLQRSRMLNAGKNSAKYATHYFFSGSLDAVLTTFRKELSRMDFVLLSALEKKGSRGLETEIYGIVAGEDLDDMLRIENDLMQKGLQVHDV